VLVVGSYAEEGVGAVYVYTRAGVDWNMAQRIQGPNEAKIQQFGWAVGLSGFSMVVGEPITESVYVYRYNGQSWDFEQNFTAINDTFSPTPRFGYSVAVFRDITVVGSQGSPGSVHIYTRIPHPSSGMPSWVGRNTLSPNSTVNELFGNCVGIFNFTVVIGAGALFVDNQPFLCDELYYNCIEEILPSGDIEPDLVWVPYFLAFFIILIILMFILSIWWIYRKKKEAKELEEEFNTKKNTQANKKDDSDELSVDEEHQNEEENQKMESLTQEEEDARHSVDLTEEEENTLDI